MRSKEKKSSDEQVSLKKTKSNESTNTNIAPLSDINSLAKLRKPKDSMKSNITPSSDEKVSSKKTKSNESTNTNIAPLSDINLSAKLTKPNQSKNTITIPPSSQNLAVKRRKQNEFINTINTSSPNQSSAASEKISLNKDLQSTDTRRPKRKKDKSIDVKQSTPSSSSSSSPNPFTSSSSSSSSFSNEIVVEKTVKNVISSNMFTSNSEVSLCQLGLEEHAKEIRHLFRTIFGLNPTSISSGITITASQKDNLLDFMSKEFHNKSFKDIVPGTYFGGAVFNFGNISLNYQAIESIACLANSGYLNDEVRDIFLDSVNLHNELDSITLPSPPPIYAINVFGITPLYKYAICSDDSSYNIDIKQFDSFEEEIKHAICGLSMRSTLGNILKAYRFQTDNKIKQLYGNLHINGMHYVSVIIDLDKKLVETCDPHVSNFTSSEKSVTLIRKWISKSMSILDYYLDPSKKDIELYLGSKDMCCGDTFEESDRKTFEFDKEYMYNHKDISFDVDYPVQEDGFNCGVYSFGIFCWNATREKTLLYWILIDFAINFFFMLFVYIYIFNAKMTNRIVFLINFFGQHSSKRNINPMIIFICYLVKYLMVSILI